MCDNSASSLHWQSTILIFAAVALPVTVVVGLKGPEFWITGVESGLVIGGAAAGIFYFATGGSIMGALVGDSLSIVQNAICGVEHAIFGDDSN